ncbi:MAG: peroxiredoxin family protein [Vicinamibacterales bacterium]
MLDDFLRKADLPWKVACSWAGWEDATAKLYQISATPSTWLIDRGGVVRYCDVRGEELRKAVEALVTEESSEPHQVVRAGSAPSARAGANR